MTTESSTLPTGRGGIPPADSANWAHPALYGDLKRVLFHETTILSRLDEMAAEIADAYLGKDLTVVAILNGSLIFMADLLRRIPLPLRLDCLSVSSYHDDVESSGVVTFNQLSLPKVKGRHVILLDDILDSGRTLAAIQERMSREGEALSIRICVLLKKCKQRACAVRADFTGFEIDDEFVVGYGLDYAERYRNLPLIGILKDEVVKPTV